MTRPYLPALIVGGLGVLAIAAVVVFLVVWRKK